MKQDRPLAAAENADQPAAQPRFWRGLPDGVSVAVKVQPRAKRAGVQDVVDSADGPRLRIAVNDPPEDGKANRAVCIILADALNVPRGTVAVAAGAAAREKRLMIKGDPIILGEKLAAL